MPQFAYSCSNCDFRADDVSSWSRFSYQCQCAFLPVKWEPGWCSQCRSVTAVEVLPSRQRIEQLQKEIGRKLPAPAGKEAPPGGERSWIRRLRQSLAALVHGGPAAGGRIHAPESDLTEEVGRLRTLRRRSSAPRCLSCGSVAVTRLQPDEGRSEGGAAIDLGFLHPGCGGRLLRARVDARVRRVPVHRIYSSEGLLLHERERP